MANDRCDQPVLSGVEGENLIGQMKNGVKAMRMPVGDLVSNWAYMVIASLAWTLKAWFALTLPGGKGAVAQAAPGAEAGAAVDGVQAVHELPDPPGLSLPKRVPCQIATTGRRVVYRLLSCNAWTGVLLRAAERLHQHQPLRC